MTYRELLELYKKGRLHEEQRDKVARDIERQEAIGDYLFEKEEIPGLKEAFGAETGGQEGSRLGISLEEKEAQGGSPDDLSFGYHEEEAFLSIVNRSIRRAFLKMGLIVFAAALCIILFVQFVLPGLVSSFYYDPTEQIGTKSYTVNKMSRDMAVYSELFLPGKQRQSVSAEAEGYGVYNITVYQTHSRNRSMTDVSGRIVRNKLIYYDINVLSKPSVNVFAWYYVKQGKSLSESLTDEDNQCAAGTRKDSQDLLKDLDDNKLYIAYVSLDSMMDYEKFMKYLDGQDLDDVWCAVQTEDYYPVEYEDGSRENWSYFTANNTGFICNPVSYSVNYWDNEKYPELLPGCNGDDVDNDEDDAVAVEDNMKKESYAATHFTSLLRYMADQGKFLSMMNGDDYDGSALNTLKEEADYVEKNGIKVYGYAVTVDKKTAIKLSKQKQVYEVYTEEVR